MAQMESDPLNETGVFLLVVHDREAHFLVHLACELVRQGHNTTFLVLQSGGKLTDQQSESRLKECQVAVYPIPLHSYSSNDLDYLQHELVEHIPDNLDVVISALENLPFSRLSTYLAQNGSRGYPSVVRIPEDDLPYCDWMFAVELEGWKSEFVHSVLIFRSLTAHRLACAPD